MLLPYVAVSGNATGGLRQNGYMSEAVVDRKLAWEGIFNARDLGGVLTTNGPTRFGAFVRSDNLSRLSTAGQQALLDYGIRTVIDLRAPRELALHLNPLRGHPVYRHLPLLSDLDLETVAAIRDQSAVYRYFADRCGTSLRRVLEGIAKAPEGGVLIHCHAGKDRTGLVCALLLSLAGATHEQIIDDYALSDLELAPLYSIWAAEKEPDPALRDALTTRFRTPPERMIELLAHIDVSYGGVESYLGSIGVSEATRHALKRRLLGH